MQIERISYQKTFNLGSYQSERIGVDIILNAGESATEALDTAKSLVSQYHKDNNPQLQELISPPALEKVIAVSPQVHPKLSQKEVVMQEINLSQSVNQLEGVRILSQKYPETKELYDTKLKQLQS